MDDTFDGSGAVVIPDGDPEAGDSGLGDKAVPAVFKPLQTPSQVTINAEVNELDISDQDLDPNTVKVIKERVKAKLNKNKDHAHRALNFYFALLIKMYCLLSTLTNITSNSVGVYLKLFSVTDTNQQR